MGSLLRPWPAALALLIGTASALADAPYPARPVRLVVPTNPGGAPDTLARILAPAALPVNNIQEFVQYVAARPGKLTYGSSGIGSSHHLIMEALLNRGGGLSMIHVPFKGSQDNMQALLGGNLDFSIFGLSSAI